ncbi:MAG: solute carrier family 23 protein [Erysipelotrichaceae bacterium]|nr:solute carrier family 23 protein [Erysipelotrichaceae bacterium]
MSNKKVMGYLPEETPEFGKLILYALQQVVVMFPATITVALITGFQVSTTIFASGLATLCFILITKKKIPLYYGSSFAYLSAISAMAMAEGTEAQIASWQATGILPAELISKAQFGIIMSGFVSIFAGLIVKKFGAEKIEKFLPASITGSVSMVIGLTLAGSAMGDFLGVGNSVGGAVIEAGSTNAALWLVVALVTFISTCVYSRYLKGLLSQLPLLLGVLTGCAVAGVIYFVGGVSLFRAVPAEALAASSFKLGDGSIFALPAFTFPKFSLNALIGIMPIAIATIPESTAHMYQLEIYINDVAKEKGKEKRDMISLLGDNLIGDGLCDMISGVVGGPAGTNYGENISTMAITRVFSVPVLIAASVIAMLVSCFTPLIQTIYGIPLAVIGGIEVYCFGAIAAQGIAILIDKGVSMFDSKNIAVIALVSIVGIGGNYAFGGNIPFFGMSIPCIAAAAIFGIILNALLTLGDSQAKDL